MVPVAVWFLPRSYSLVLLGAIVAAAVLVEHARRNVRWFRSKFLASTRRMLRARERDAVTGATYMAIGYFLAVLLFPRPIAVAAMLYNAIGDGVAALVGTTWGHHRTGWGKSYEGLLAGFLANLGVGLAVPGIAPVPALVGAAAAAVLEFLPLRTNDNLTVPIGGGLVVWLVSRAVVG